MAIKKTKKTTPKTEIIEEEISTDSIETLSTKSRRPLIFSTILFVAALAGILYYFKGMYLAAMVNGTPITRFAVIRELEKQAGNKALESIITEKLIEQEAKKKNVTITQKEIDEELKKLEQQFLGQNLDQMLAAQGLTRDRVKEQIKVQKQVEKILSDKLKVSDKEATDYLEKNKEALEQQEQTPSKEQIKEQLKQQKLQTEFQKWLENLRKNAKISTFVQY